MNIAFVHGHLQLGGIETLLLKLSRELSALGHHITIVAGPDGNPSLEHQIARHARLERITVSYARSFPQLRRLDLANIDLFFACGAPQLVFAAALRDRLAPHAALMAGVYLPWEYFGTSKSRRFDWALGERLFSALPDENIVFMNEACRSEHAAAFSRPFAASPIIPLPVDVRSGARTSRVDRSRIVTIGRIVEFKPTTWHMVHVIRELRHAGFDLKYDVYGDGTGMESLRATIHSAGLDEVVRLHGSINYERIPAVLDDAFLFVGVATAALEAAALGVPTLLGVESPEPVTLGFMHETTNGEMGEVSSRGRRYALADRIRALLAMSPQSYDALARQGVEHVAQFSSHAIGGRYADAFAHARPFEGRLGIVAYVRTLASIARWAISGALGQPHPDMHHYDRRAANSAHGAG